MREVEVRHNISEEDYNRLLQFFSENAKQVHQEIDQQTTYFDCKPDVRLQKNNNHSVIKFKSGTINEDEDRKEIEIKIEKDDYHKALEIFKQLNINPSIQWYRTRNDFQWNDIEVSLGHTKGWGHVIELEKSGTEEETDTILKQFTNILERLKIQETSKEEWKQKYVHYEHNWRELTNDQ